jgi:[protein-PII] uridylyltransferase
MRTAALLDKPVARSAGPEPVAIPREVRRGVALIAVSPADGGVRVTVLAPDRPGLLADVAAIFALQRASVRSARAWSQGDIGVSVWDVAEETLDERVLRQRFEAITAGRLGPATRWRPQTGRIAPTVVVRPEASAQATVLEIRTDDQPGVVHRVCAVLAALGVTVRSAHVDTLGPQAVDVFYVQESSAGALSDSRAAEAADAVRSALTDYRGQESRDVGASVEPRLGWKPVPRPSGLTKD